MAFTNNHDIPLAIAVWLASDYYDYNSDSNYISATSLLRPTKQIILASRQNNIIGSTDLSDLAASSIGNALHDSIEKAWVTNKNRALATLGYPPSIIERILVNPTPEDLANAVDPIPVYIEQRSVKILGKWQVGGKFDLIANGVLHDNKSTSTYAWTAGTRDEDYQLQGSIYRWLNQDKVTEDFIRINFIFTDWQKFVAKRDPNYPQCRIQSKEIPLLSIGETEMWIAKKLADLEKYWNSPESEIPDCTQKELWASDPSYKYYSDPNKTDGRATRVFTSLNDARVYQVSKGGVGTIKTVPGEPKRCNYCDAFNSCEQAKRYFK